MRQTWKFMTDHGVKLDDDTSKLPLHRANDCTIMEQFRENKHISADNMKRLNRCRIFIKAFVVVIFYIVLGMVVKLTMDVIHQCIPYGGDPTYTIGHFGEQP